jgi:hypothetical protein
MGRTNEAFLSYHNSGYSVLTTHFFWYYRTPIRTPITPKKYPQQAVTGGYDHLAKSPYSSGFVLIAGYGR